MSVALDKEIDHSSRTEHNPAEKGVDTPSPREVGASLSSAGRQLKACTRALRQYLPLCERDQHNELYSVAVASARRFKDDLLPLATDVVQKTRRCCDDFQSLSLRDYCRSGYPTQLADLRHDVDQAKSFHDQAMADSRKLLEGYEVVDNNPEMPQSRNGRRGPLEDIARSLGRGFNSFKKAAGSLLGGPLIGITAGTLGITAGSLVVPTLAGGTVSSGAIPLMVVVLAAFGAALVANRKYQDLERQIESCKATNHGVAPPEYPKASLLGAAQQFRAAMLDLDAFLGDVQRLVSMDSEGCDADRREIDEMYASAQAKSRSIMEACESFHFDVIDASTDLMSLEEILDDSGGHKQPWSGPLKVKIEQGVPWRADSLASWMHQRQAPNTNKA